MFFVYILALIGLFTLVFLALAYLSEPVDPTPTEADPYDESLDAVARLQAGAWEAIQEMNRLDRRADR